MCSWWNVHLSYGTVLVAQHEASTHTLVLSRHPPTLSISPCPTADVSTATATAAAAAASFESAGPSFESAGPSLHLPISANAAIIASRCHHRWCLHRASGPATAHDDPWKAFET